MPSNKDWLPAADAEFQSWSLNFIDRLETGGTPTGNYSLTIAQIANYRSLHDTYSAALIAATQDVSRTPVAIGAKDNAKDDLVAAAREYVGIIQRSPDTTDNQRDELQIPVYDKTPTPSPIPNNFPGVEVRERVQRTVTLRLQDLDAPTSRTLPDRVSGATIFTWVGDDPPASPGDWKFSGIYTKTIFTIVFPEDVPLGSKVWVSASWYNARGQHGLNSPPLAINLDSGTPASQAA